MSMIADAKYQELNIFFSFQIQDNKLLITANIANVSYQAERLYDPDLDFDDIKDALVSKEFKIISQNQETLKLKICKVITLEFKAKDKIALNQLKDTVSDLTKKLNQQVQKNVALEKHVSKLSEQLGSMTTKISDITGQMEQNQKLILTLKQQLFESNKKIELNQSQIISLKAQITQLKSPKIMEIPQKQGSILQNSKIVTSIQERENIKTFFGKKTIKSTKLLYCASEHNFSTDKFHQKCNQIPNTLILCETEYKKKIGGFTPLVWESLEAEKYINDESGESFMFSLSSNDKFVLQEKSKAILNSKRYGPYFGGGSDLAINKDSRQNDCYSFLNVSYHNGNYQKNDNSSKTKFHGRPQASNSFKIFEWEVWQVEFA